MREEEQTKAVAAFMTYAEAPKLRTLGEEVMTLSDVSRSSASRDLDFCAKRLESMARFLLYSWELNEKDQRLMRAHLMCEELSELMMAMAHVVELDALDALVDLDYVVRGTAIQFKLPMDEAFGLVHAANMLKDKGAFWDREGNKGKPEGWEPPDLLPVLKKARRDEPQE